MSRDERRFSRHFTATILKAIRHPELVEGSASMRVAIIFRWLILRQAQDDRILKRAFVLPRRWKLALPITFGAWKR
jgi:hypothetical protein